MSGQPSDSKVRSGRAVRNAGNAPAVAGHDCVRRYSLRMCKLHVRYKRRVRSIAGGRCWFQSGSFGGLLCRDEPPYRRVVCRWIHQRRRGGRQSGCLLAQQAPQPRSQIEVKCHIVGRMNENSAVGCAREYPVESGCCLAPVSAASNLETPEESEAVHHSTERPYTPSPQRPGRSQEAPQRRRTRTVTTQTATTAAPIVAETSHDCDPTLLPRLRVQAQSPLHRTPRRPDAPSARASGTWPGVLRRPRLQSAAGLGCSLYSLLAEPDSLLPESCTGVVPPTGMETAPEELMPTSGHPHSALLSRALQGASNIFRSLIMPLPSRCTIQGPIRCRSALEATI